MRHKADRINESATALSTVGATHELPLLKKNLPEGWVKTSMNNVCAIILGQSPPSSTYNANGEGLPFFQGKAEFGERYPIVIKYCSTPKKTAQKNDILISVRAPVGPTNIAPSECCIGRGLAAIRPLENIEHLYVFYYLRSIEHELSKIGTGTTFKAISGSDLRSIQIPLAPLDQQKLIVAEIEKQFSRLDEAVAALKRIQANLKRYKASVLKAAVEGKLTEEWRKNNLCRGGVSPPRSCLPKTGRGDLAPTEYETGAELLKRILIERRKKWEEDYVKKYVGAHGHAPKDDTWKTKYKEPAAPDISNLPELPERWVWGSIEQLATLITDGDHNPPKRVQEGIPHLTAKNIINGKIVESNCTFISKEDFKKVRKRYEPMTDDVIITCVGTIGRTAIVPPNYAFSADRNLAAVRLVNNGISPKILRLILDSPYAQTRMHNASGSTAQPHFYLSALRSFVVPLFPRQEQKELTKLVEKQLSDIDQIEVTMKDDLKRIEHLRQSILKKAFSGGLIPNGNVL